MFTIVRRSAAPLQRARYLHTSPTVFNGSKSSGLSPDTYNKDVDPTPPSDSSIHRVDPSSENVQKPHEAPSGEWSRAGVKTDEYRNVNQNTPYATAPPQDMRYGGKAELDADKGTKTSKPNEGPDGTESRGRKPEGH